MTAVLICAAGDGTRWHGGQPKQLAWLGDETILQRQIRQVKARGVIPWVLTHDEELARASVRAGATAHMPHYRRWLVETIHSTRQFWQARTIILLGDVIYSQALMDALFADTRPVSVYGNNAEALALTFDAAGEIAVLHALQAVLSAAEQGKGYGKLWNIYRALDNLPIERHTIREKGVFVRVHDWSTDIDTPEAYQWVQRNLLELQVIDDRLPVGAL